MVFTKTIPFSKEVFNTIHMNHEIDYSDTYIYHDEDEDIPHGCKRCYYYNLPSIYIGKKYYYFDNQEMMMKFYDVDDDAYEDEDYTYSFDICYFGDNIISMTYDRRFNFLTIKCDGDFTFEETQNELFIVLCMNEYIYFSFCADCVFHF